MEDLCGRIQRVRQDLAAIEEQLNWAAPRRPEAAGPENAVIDGVRELKAAVDEMRVFLWSYFEHLTQSDRELPLPDPLMATATLEQVDPAAPPPPCEIHSFFEDVQSLATRLVERHMNNRVIE